MTRQRNRRAGAIALALGCLVLCGCGLVPDTGPTIQETHLLDELESGRLQAPRWVGTDAVAPTVTITVLTHVDSKGLVGLSGVAADDRRLQRVRWSNNRGGSGLAMLTGSTSSTRWWVTSIQLQPGDNTLVVTAFDAAGNSAQARTVVTRTPAPPANVAAWDLTSD